MKLLNASCNNEQLSIACAAAIKSLNLDYQYDRVYKDISIDII